MNSLLTAEGKASLLAKWEKEGGLSGNTLKVIACIFMFIDHLSQGVALNSIDFRVTDSCLLYTSDAADDSTEV